MEEKKSKFINCQIVKREDVTKDLWKIWIEPEELFNFEAGQYCTVGVDGLERPYSIASSPKETLIELFIELVPPPDGKLTPVLHNLNTGSNVTIRRRAKGLFKYKEGFTNHIMVSTVTGVAPFVSMIREGKVLEDPNRKVWVYEGASFIDEFAYDKELEFYSKKNSNLFFTPTCSRPDEPENTGWAGTAGRVNNIFKSVFNEINEANKENTILYACGHPEMVTELSKNYSDKLSFIEEKFWKP